jgi:methionyl aminopeptidase
MTIRAKEEEAGLEAAGRVVANALAAMRSAVRPGVSTEELDAISANVFRAEGARSAPRLVYDFPGTSCISVNDEVVHGVPGERRLRAGDLVKLDVTAEKDGFMADAARTVAVGPPSAVAANLAACVRIALRRALTVVRPGIPIRRIGREIESVVRQFGFSVVRELSGHGIGRTIHEAPAIPNFDDPRSRERLEEGMVIAIEPIVSAGSGEAVLAADGWTVRTSDGSFAAHHEQTLVVTSAGPRVLTRA